MIGFLKRNLSRQLLNEKETRLLKMNSLLDVIPMHAILAMMVLVRNKFIPGAEIVVPITA